MMDDLLEIKADLKGIERRYQELDGRNRELDRRLIILEVSSAERHMTTLGAITAMKEALGERVVKLERVVWGTAGLLAVSVLGALLNLVLKGA